MMLDPWWGSGPNVGLWVNILHVSALSVSSPLLPLILRDVSFFKAPAAVLLRFIKYQEHFSHALH